jgi:hypothetical protein
MDNGRYEEYPRRLEDKEEFSRDNRVGDEKGVRHSREHLRSGKRLEDGLTV